MMCKNVHIIGCVKVYRLIHALLEV